jgi:hypothetical protein
MTCTVILECPDYVDVYVFTNREKAVWFCETIQAAHQGRTCTLLDGWAAVRSLAQELMA